MHWYEVSYKILNTGEVTYTVYKMSDPEPFEEGGVTSAGTTKDGRWFDVNIFASGVQDAVMNGISFDPGFVEFFGEGEEIGQAEDQPKSGTPGEQLAN